MASPVEELMEQLNTERRRVDVAVADLTVREVVRMVQEGELNAAPAYQRKFRWQLEDESRLIESLLLGLPIPSVFVASNADFTLEVVDGLQRVSTLVHFLSPGEEELALVGRDSPLRLEGLDKLNELEALTFDEFPEEAQRYFARLPIRVTTLTDKSDATVRFQLFDRLNRGAVALSPQEVRTVVFRGELIDLIRELAETSTFASWPSYSGLRKRTEPAASSCSSSSPTSTGMTNTTAASPICLTTTRRRTPTRLTSRSVARCSAMRSAPWQLRWGRRSSDLATTQRH
jgi:hypothetical protein